MVFAKCVKSYVVLFPALDVASAFPLNAITLGNNLHHALYDSSGGGGKKPALRWFRLLAAAPPLLAAAFVSDLGTITGQWPTDRLCVTVCVTDCL